MTEPETITDVLRGDHRAIGDLFADPAATTATDEGVAAREQLVMNLVRHYVAEEQYLYPAVGDHIDVVDDLIDSHRQADRADERALRGLEDPDLTAEALGQLWSRLQSDFVAHAQRQEPLLAQLEAAGPPERLAELGEDVRGAEQIAPTRPRVVAPGSPGINKVVSLVEGYLDRARDAYGHRGVDPADEPRD